MSGVADQDPEYESRYGVFAKIYENGGWWGLGSGPGSLASVSKPFIDFLSTFILENRITSIVDFGCGDWSVMQHVDLDIVDYLGLDVVESVLLQNERHFGTAAVTFQVVPSNLEELPKADLYIFKDSLIHFPNDYSLEALHSALKKSKILFAVNDRSDNTDAYNEDIPFGGFRPVDISLAPFFIDSITVLRYGQMYILDPRLPSLVAFIRRRFVQSGEKHVQMALGTRF